MASANYAARGLAANTRINVTFMCYFHLAMEVAFTVFPRVSRNSRVASGRIIRPGASVKRIHTFFAVDKKCNCATYANLYGRI